MHKFLIFEFRETSYGIFRAGEKDFYQHITKALDLLTCEN